MHGHRVCHGFSLIELLIASSVAAGAAALLAGGLMAANRSADRRVEQARLTQLLASRLAELDDPLQDDAAASGAFPTPYEGFAWTIERINAPQEPVGVFRLQVTHEGHTVDAVTSRRIAEE